MEQEPTPGEEFVVIDFDQLAECENAQQESRGALQELLAGGEEARETRRSKLAQEIEETFTKHHPEDLEYYRQWRGDSAEKVDFSTIASEIMGASHVVTIDMIEQDYAQLSQHDPYWEGLKLTHERLMHILDVPSIRDVSSEEESAAYVTNLGRIRALDTCELDYDAQRAPPLFYDTDHSASTLPYFDMAAGFEGRDYLQHFTINRQPMQRQLLPNDHSPYIWAKFDEEFEIFAFDGADFSFAFGDAKTLHTHLDPASAGAIHFGNTGVWLHEGDTEWHQPTADLVTPNRGKIIFTVKGPWKGVGFPNPSKLKRPSQLNRMFDRMIRNHKQAEGELRANTNLVRCFHNLCMQEHEGQWEFTYGTCSYDGEFHEAQFHPDSQEDWVYRRNFVFTRLG